MDEITVSLFKKEKNVNITINIEHNNIYLYSNNRRKLININKYINLKEEKLSSSLNGIIKLIEVIEY